MKLSVKSFITSVFFLTVLLGLSSIHSYSADVYCPPGEQFKWDKHMEFIGEITAADIVAVRNCFQSKNKKVKPTVRVNSPGGDVYAAMEIGRLFRKYRVTFVFPLNSRCSSSCVFMLAGAVRKNTPMIGRNDHVGIHRPFSIKTGKLEFSKTQEDYQKTKNDVENYLLEMNIPISLFHAMERIPPKEIRFLTDEEVEEFGLEGTDPVEQELADAAQAELYGLSKREYYQREIEGDRECENNDFSNEGVQRWGECKNAIMWGLSAGVYYKRKNRAKEICNTSERRACFKEVMQGKK